MINNPSSNNSTQTVDEYLSQNELSVYFEDVVSMLLSKQPSDPIQFISDYFQSIKNGSNTIKRQYSYIKSTTVNRRGFIRIFQETIIGDINKVLSVFDIHALVELLCSDFPLDVIVQSCLIACHETIQPGSDLKSIDFLQHQLSIQDFLDVFKVAFVYEEFFQHCKDLLKNSWYSMKNRTFTSEVCRVHNEDLKQLEDTFTSTLKRNLLKSNFAVPDQQVFWQVSGKSFTPRSDSHEGNIVDHIWSTIFIKFSKF